MSRNPANTGSRAPEFLVRWERRYGGWGEALAIVLWRVPIDVLGPPARFSRNLVEAPARLPRRALFSSAVLHVFVALLVLRVPILLFGPERHLQRRQTQNAAVIYYDLGLVHFLKSLPSIQSPGPGGKPGQGNRPDRLPARGSTAFHPKLTIVSNPPRPDNKRQTIIQPASPPELRITQELRLPTVLMGNPMVVPKPQLELHVQMPRAPVQQESKPEAPVLKVYAVPSDFPLTLAPATNDSPHLPVPLPSALLASAHAPVSANQTASAGSGEQPGDPSGPSGLLVIGVDPSGIAHLLALPPGNQYGAFSVSPAGGQPGSPGGVPGGVVGGGTGGAGSGGDGSTGVGSGGSGGGGGGSGTGGVVTIAGGSGADAGVGGSLAYSASSNAVIPVITYPQIRKNALLVITGPIGGGGLGVYEALRGGKIYTKFLPMPGKSWVLQYCAAERPASKASPGSRGPVVQVDEGLVPPEPVERFDFQRLPVPEEKADKVIVLRGVIRTDGSVGELKLYRGVQPDMDQAALAAFGRWKFKPALRANQPAAVEILVGIPARVPKS